MNVGRIVLGGLLAGVWVNISEGILNAWLLMDPYQAMMEMHGLTEASWAIAVYLITGFIFGLVVAWLYAAIRPRFGPGWGTGAIAGVFSWLVGYVVPTMWFVAMGLNPGAGSMVLALVWGLVELILAGLIAGWLYREPGAPAAAAA